MSASDAPILSSAHQQTKDSSSAAVDLKRPSVIDMHSAIPVDFDDGSPGNAVPMVHVDTFKAAVADLMKEHVVKNLSLLSEKQTSFMLLLSSQLAEVKAKLEEVAPRPSDSWRTLTVHSPKAEDSEVNTRSWNYSEASASKTDDELSGASISDKPDKKVSETSMRQKSDSLGRKMRRCRTTPLPRTLSSSLVQELDDEKSLYSSESSIHLTPHGSKEYLSESSSLALAKQLVQVKDPLSDVDPARLAALANTEPSEIMCSDVGKEQAKEKAHGDTHSGDYSAQTRSAENSHISSSAGILPKSTPTSPASSRAPVALKVGLLVEVERVDGTWSLGTIHSVGETHITISGSWGSKKIRSENMARFVRIPQAMPEALAATPAVTRASQFKNGQSSSCASSASCVSVRSSVDSPASPRLIPPCPLYTSDNTTETCGERSQEQTESAQSGQEIPFKSTETPPDRNKANARPPVQFTWKRPSASSNFTGASSGSQLGSHVGASSGYSNMGTSVSISQSGSDLGAVISTVASKSHLNLWKKVSMANITQMCESSLMGGADMPGIDIGNIASIPGTPTRVRRGSLGSRSSAGSLKSLESVSEHAPPSEKEDSEPFGQTMPKNSVHSRKGQGIILPGRTIGCESMDTSVGSNVAHFNTRRTLESVRTNTDERLMLIDDGCSVQVSSLWLKTLFLPRWVMCFCGVLPWRDGPVSKGYMGLTIGCIIALLCLSVHHVATDLENSVYISLFNLLYAIGILVGTIGSHAKDIASILGPKAIPLEMHAHRDGYLHAWLYKSFQRFVSVILIWLATCIPRSLAVGVPFDIGERCVSDGHSNMTNLAIFWVLSFILSMQVFSQLHASGGLELMVDDYCIRFLLSKDTSDATIRWNVIQAFLRRCGSTLEPCMLALLTCEIMALALAGVQSLEGQGPLNRSGVCAALWGSSLLGPVVVSLYSLLHIATVTEKCIRVPSLVNTMLSSLFHDESYVGYDRLISYIDHSAAGFYVKGMRLSAFMVIKLCYILGLYVLTLTAQSFRSK